MKYKQDAEGFIIISLTEQEIEKYDRDSLKLWAKIAVCTTIFVVAMVEFVQFLSSTVS